MNTLLMYFSASVTATIGGVMFYMAVENLHPPSDTESRRKELATCILLSAFLTPLGAWIISMVIRLKQLPPLP
jgi:zinc transporter ZupT